MKRLILISTLVITLTLTACAPSSPMTMDHGESDMSGEMLTKDRLNESPRHHEWVEVQYGDRTVHTWVVYPERSDAAPAVLVIHENRGLNDWARSLADQVAESGSIAVAPDLLSGFSKEFERTSDFPDEDSARDALYQLDADQVQADLVAVAEYAKELEASNGKIVTAGFCWGGAQSFEFATKSDLADAIMVFYGTSPEQVSAYEGITAPVYGFYGGNDERVNATIERAELAMSQLGKTYDVEIYEGAGHAFMRNGEESDADAFEKAARDQAFDRMEDILQSLE